MGRRQCKCISKLDRNGKFRILSASQQGHTKCVEKLSAKIAQFNLTSDYRRIFGEALVEACGRGYTKIIKILIQAKPDLDEGLCAAAKNGHTKIAEGLLQHGASANCFRTVQERLYMLYECDCNGHDVVYYNPVLIEAIIKGNIEITRLLLKWGAHVNSSMWERNDPKIFDSICRHITNTALQHIRLQDNIWVKIIKLLLLHNADARSAEFDLKSAGMITAFNVAIRVLKDVLYTLGRHATL